MKEFIVKNEEETMRVGEDFSKTLNPQDIVFLIGDLGVGKTTFTKGVAKGLGITTRVISPTFVIVRSHNVSSAIKTFYHLDLYRLSSEKEALDIDIKDIINDPTGLTFIEWPDNVKRFITKQHYVVSIAINEDESRTITIHNE